MYPLFLFFFSNSPCCTRVSRVCFSISARGHPVFLLVVSPAACQRCSPSVFSVTSGAALWVTHKAVKCHYLGELVGGKGSFLVRHKTTHLSSRSLLQIILCVRDCSDELICVVDFFFFIVFITQNRTSGCLQLKWQLWRIVCSFLPKIGLFVLAWFDNL